VQSVPNIICGPAKKNIVPPKKTAKKTKTPIENKPNKQAPLFYFLDIPFIDPVKPAIPSNKKRIEVIYNAIKDPVTADWLTALKIYFFSTCA